MQKYLRGEKGKTGWGWGAEMKEKGQGAF